MKQSLKTLFDDAISKMGCPMGFYDPNSFKLDTFGSDMIKQPNPLRKQYGGNMQLDLVKERRFKALLGYCRATQHIYVFIEHLIQDFAFLNPERSNTKEELPSSVLLHYVSSLVPVRVSSLISVDEVRLCLGIRVFTIRNFSLHMF
ncbi:hypothetical protein PAECIP111802_01203 [Paenibacillus allorhizosphaerae]|uniref:Transposase n=1 Tax=Paenibacillus allorhizosphaerae TaxID=2849866 RepID=A0ABN7THF2_9BACL|nr:hypothetical protein PAECIP111802_01203 [Paenibacillus allorhizosphaerae]